MTEEQKGVCLLQLNSISPVENDPTLAKCTFSILDFEVSGNKQVVSKELGLEASPTLAYKPLVAQYFPTTDYENKNDHFGNHGVYKTKDRNGNDVITTNTIAIGTASEAGAYLGTIKDENNNDIEVLLCDFYLWVDKYPDIVALISEMWENGIPLKTSCEYVYSNYKVENGIQYVLSPLIFLGHCLLNSGENGTGSVEPAYHSSQMVSFNEKWQKTVAQAIQNQSVNSVEINNVQKEDKQVPENLFYKALCEMSFGDIREQIMTALSKTMTADEFYSVWVSNYAIYDSYFVYECYVNDSYVNYKVPYTKTETSVEVDLSNKVQVERDSVWVEVFQLETVQNSLDEANTTIESLTTQLNSVNETVATLTSEKEGLEVKFNEAAETITSLNAKVEDMIPVVEQFNNEQLEKSINEKKDYYVSKFKAVNAMDKFESEEVQSLIKLSINESVEGKDAILSLNTMLVEMVQFKNEDAQPAPIKEYSSKNENLIHLSVDFDSRYGD